MSACPRETRRSRREIRAFERCARDEHPGLDPPRISFDGLQGRRDFAEAGIPKGSKTLPPPHPRVPPPPAPSQLKDVDPAAAAALKSELHARLRRIAYARFTARTALELLLFERYPHRVEIGAAASLSLSAASPPVLSCPRALPPSMKRVLIFRPVPLTRPQKPYPLDELAEAPAAASYDRPEDSQLAAEPGAACRGRGSLFAGLRGCFSSGLRGILWWALFAALVFDVSS